jgi:hypothetical protein
MSKLLNTLKHTLEIIWLLVAIACIGLAIFENIKVGFKQALPFYAFSAVSLFFYTSRRKERINPKI